MFDIANKNSYEELYAIATKLQMKALVVDSLFFAVASFFGILGAGAVGMTEMVSVDIQEIAGGAFYGTDGQLQAVGVNPRYGAGSLSEVRFFQSGIAIVIQDFSLYGDGKIRISVEETKAPGVAFFTCFSGVGHIGYKKPRVPLGNGCSIIEFSGYKPGRFMEVKGNTPVRAFSVCMAPDVFEKMTGKNRNELVEALDVIDHKAGKRNLARSKKNDFAQNLCGHQAFDSLRNNPHDALFLEAKALELVALQLNQLEHLAGRRPQKQAVRYVDKVSRACEILRKEMASPPTLPALSRRVGLNHNQLIQGFREMFGVSPFEYLRIIRLETARDLIASRECNVTEAAFTVGYSSLSHFTRTFREKFGVNPKAFAKEKKGFLPG